MKWRYATKAFDGSKKLTQEDRDTLFATLNLAPSSLFLQPWKFVVIDDPEIRKTLGSFVPANKSKIEDSAFFVVLARRRATSAEDVSRHVDLLQAERGVSPEVLHPFREMVTKSVASK